MDRSKWPSGMSGRVTVGPPAPMPSFASQEADFYKVHPEARVTPGNNPLYSQQDREEMNALYGTPSPAENFFHTLMPANLRAAVGTYIGDQEPITQHYFSDADLAAMREHYLRRQADYAQHPYDVNMPYPEYSRQFHDMRSVQSLPDLGNVLQSYADQDYRIAPFTQGAYYENSPEGTYMVNEYRAGQHQRPVRVLLPQ